MSTPIKPMTAKEAIHAVLDVLTDLNDDLTHEEALERLNLIKKALQLDGK